jgi:hypothetical protein
MILTTKEKYILEKFMFKFASSISHPQKNNTRFTIHVNFATRNSQATQINTIS